MDWTKMVQELDQIKECNEKLKHTLQLQLKENDRLKVCPRFTVKSERFHPCKSPTLTLLPGGDGGPADQADGDRATP